MKASYAQQIQSTASIHKSNIDPDRILQLSFDNELKLQNQFQTECIEHLTFDLGQDGLVSTDDIAAYISSFSNEPLAFYNLPTTLQIKFVSISCEGKDLVECSSQAVKVNDHEKQLFGLEENEFARIDELCFEAFVQLKQMNLIKALVKDTNIPTNVPSIISSNFPSHMPTNVPTKNIPTDKPTESLSHLPSKILPTSSDAPSISKSPLPTSLPSMESNLPTSPLSIYPVISFSKIPTPLHISTANYSVQVSTPPTLFHSNIPTVFKSGVPSSVKPTITSPFPSNNSDPSGFTPSITNITSQIHFPHVPTNFKQPTIANILIHSPSVAPTMDHTYIPSHFDSTKPSLFSISIMASKNNIDKNELGIVIAGALIGSCVLFLGMMIIAYYKTQVSQEMVILNKETEESNKKWKNINRRLFYDIGLYEDQSDHDKRVGTLCLDVMAAQQRSLFVNTNFDEMRINDCDWQAEDDIEAWKERELNSQMNSVTLPPDDTRFCSQTFPSKPTPSEQIVQQPPIQSKLEDRNILVGLFDFNSISNIPNEISSNDDGMSSISSHHSAKSNNELNRHSSITPQTLVDHDLAIKDLTDEDHRQYVNRLIASRDWAAVAAETAMYESDDSSTSFMNSSCVSYSNKNNEQTRSFLDYVVGKHNFTSNTASVVEENRKGESGKGVFAFTKPPGHYGKTYGESNQNLENSIGDISQATIDFPSSDVEVEIECISNLELSLNVKSNMTSNHSSVRKTKLSISSISSSESKRPYRRLQNRNENSMYERNDDYAQIHKSSRYGKEVQEDQQESYSSHSNSKCRLKRSFSNNSYVTEDEYRADESSMSLVSIDDERIKALETLIEADDWIGLDSKKSNLKQNLEGANDKKDQPSIPGNEPSPWNQPAFAWSNGSNSTSSPDWAIAQSIDVLLNNSVLKSEDESFLSSETSTIT